MKKILAVLIVILFFSIHIVSFANENSDDWKFSKKINYSDGNEYKSFFLDEEVYRYSKDDLSDIRIINDKNEFVPYYILNKYCMDEQEGLYENYKKTKHPNFKINIKNNDTVILIDNKNHLNINDIKIISKDDFKRNYDIYYKNDEYGEFEKADSGTIYKINLENYKEEKNIIVLDSISNYFIKSDSIKMVIHNKDDRPINIENIQINYYIDKVVFKRDSRNKYTVLFGSEYAGTPSYDIQSYKNYIEKENQEICTLSDLIERNIKYEKKEDEKSNYELILNIIVILISLILVIIIMRKSTELEQ